MTDSIIYEKVGAVAKIWFNRPERRNMFNRLLMDQLSEALDAAESDREVRVIVLQGKGKDFCAGYDHSNPEAIIAAEGEVVPFEARRLDTDSDFKYYSRFFDIKKPIICGIRGEVIGQAVWITMLCDCVIAGSDTNFNDLEYPAGLNYSDGFPIWYWKMPMNIAMEFALTGYPIDAETGHRYGLFNRVVEPEKVDEACMKLASRMLRLNPYTLEIQHEMGRLAYELKGMKHILPIAKEALNASITMTRNPRSDTYWNNAKVNGSESQPKLFWQMIEDLKKGDDWII